MRSLRGSRRLLVGVTLAGTLVVTGCGSSVEQGRPPPSPAASPTTPSPTPTPTPTTPPQVADAIVAATDEYADAKVRYSFIFGVPLPDKNARVSCSRDEGCRYAFAKETVLVGSQRHETRVLVIGDSLYVRSPDGSAALPDDKPWVKAPLRGVATGESDLPYLHFGLNFAWELLNPRTAAMCLRYGTDVQQPGDGKYESTVSAEKLAQVAPSSIRHVWSTYTSAGVKDVRCTLRVDDAFRVTQMRIEVPTTATVQGMAVEAKYSSWGQSEPVTAPSKAQVNTVG